MPKPNRSALVEAATSFDAALATYSRLGELFLKTPLTGLKQLERANQALAELADCEQRLQQAGKQLIDALTEARGRQEALASEVIAHAPAVQARNTQLRELMTALGELASEASKVNAKVTSREGGEAPDVAEVSEATLALSQRAEQLAASAHDAGFEEVAGQAHALHQRLRAIGTKLQKAAGN